MTRRLPYLVCVFLVALAVAPAVAKSPATLTVHPNEAGKGSTATLDVSPPDAARNPRSLVLRVVHGVKVDPRAVARKCTPAQANANRCPEKSRIGRGSADATVKVGAFPASKITVPVDLYLAPPPKKGDRAGIVAHVKEKQSGTEGHTTGRLRSIHQGQYGIEANFDKLEQAFTAPQGVKVHVDRLTLNFGAHRKITKKNGKRVRVDLIRNPKLCPGSWPYSVTLGYSGRSPYVVKDSVDCTPVPVR